MKTRIEILALAVLAIVLGYYAYERIGIRMGGTPSSIQSEFTSEEDWILDGILNDIGGAAAYASDVSVDDVELRFERISSEAFALPSASVDVAIGDVDESTHTIALERSFWNPENYSELARELLDGPLPNAPPEDETGLLETLLEPLPHVLVAESSRIASRLASDIRDARAHEEAALLLGAFGLREAAYRFQDVRFVLGRITAHLSIARGLRGDAPPSTTGLVAESALLALSGRQVELLEKLEELPNEPSSAGASWRQALYLYSTEDWRPEPSRASLLVELQRFRALVASLGASTALDRMGEEARTELADWGRIITGIHPRSVAGRSAVTSQVGRELAELEEVSLLYNKSPLSPQRFGELLNQPPGRLVGEEGPRVLDWGLWAAFFQRHVAGAIAASDEHVRGSLGMPDEAEALGRRADSLAADLALNPIVQVRRTRYVGGRVEDTIGMDGAIALTRRSPELVNPTNWAFLEDTTSHMVRKRGMPDGTSWLSESVLVTSAVDAGGRLRVFGRTLDARAASAEMLAIAPRHPLLVREYVDRLLPEEKTVERVSEAYGERLDFDMHALKKLLEVSDQNEAWDVRADVLRRMCRLDPNECTELGWALARENKPEEAAAAFQRAVDEASSRVGVCNNANWLVNYYYDNGRRHEAVAIADMVESVFCSWGIRTKAYLLERMGRVAQAEQLYQAEAARYESDGPVSYPLLGFYYRMARVEKGQDYEARFERLASKVFPEGLEPLPAEEDPQPPTDGVFIDGDSKRLQWAELRGADVIVGLDGWHVRSLEQYDAIQEFRARPSDDWNMSLRVWRQSQYLDVETVVPGRYFGVRMRTFGTPGPSFLYR